MCEEPELGTGAILGSALGGVASVTGAALQGVGAIVGGVVGVAATPAVLAVGAVVGSGSAIYALAGGSVVVSFAILAATGAVAISGIVALAKAASPVRKVPAQSPVRPTLDAPRRRPVRVVASQTATLALEEGRPSFDYVVTQEQRVTSP